MRDGNAPQVGWRWSIVDVRNAPKHWRETPIGLISTPPCGDEQMPMDEYGEESDVGNEIQIAFFELHEHSFSTATSSFSQSLFTAIQRFHKHRLLSYKTFMSVRWHYRQLYSVSINFDSFLCLCVCSQPSTQLGSHQSDQIQMIGIIFPYYYAVTILAISCIVNILERSSDVGVRCDLLGLGAWPTNLLWHHQWRSHWQYLLSYTGNIGS